MKAFLTASLVAATLVGGVSSAWARPMHHMRHHHRMMHHHMHHPMHHR